MDDIAFVALSKYMGGLKLWTGDKALVKGLEKKGFENCITTEQLLKIQRKIEEKGKEK